MESVRRRENDSFLKPEKPELDVRPTIQDPRSRQAGNGGRVERRVITIEQKTMWSILSV